MLGIFALSLVLHSTSAFHASSLPQRIVRPWLRPGRVCLEVPDYQKRKPDLRFLPCDSDADGCLAYCAGDDGDACRIIAPAGVIHRLKVGAYFGLWFFLSVCYSITNKRVNNMLPCPCSVATSVVVVGAAFTLVLWLTRLRSMPRLPPSALRTLLPIGIFHAAGHMAGTVGVAAGSVSFTQVVKAAGPVYACVLSWCILKQPVSRRIWLSLVPIVTGVSIATMTELSFAWAALLGAASSDLAMAMRNILAKQSMGSLTDVNGVALRPTEMFGLLTCISAAVSLPVAWVVEGHALSEQWATAAAASGMGSSGLVAQICLAGLLFYLYSEVAMQALNNVHAVTHAVGNVIRRVFILVASLAVFGTPMTTLGAVGSTIAIAGSYLYALAKHHEKLDAQASEPRAVKQLVIEASVNQALPLSLEEGKTGEMEQSTNTPESIDS